MRLDQRKAPRSSLRPYSSSVAMGMTMLTARVIRNTPMMNAMKRKAGRGIEQAHRGNDRQYRLPLQDVE
ncbi:hypothetical protein D3C76_1732520 [compost metagenome]